MVGALLLTAAAIGLLRPRPSAVPTPVPEQAEPSPAQPPRMRDTGARPLAWATAMDTEGGSQVEKPAGAPTNWVQRLLSEGPPEPLPRESIERWLQANHTNAESLLAARQAGAGREYLYQALTNYPNDPRVLFSALSLDDSAAAKRERLERFKAAAPENALVDYLSAREHLKSGQPEKAMQDLLAASQKTGFQDYMLDAIQNCEELYLSAGKSPAEAKALGCSSALLPHLSQLKGLAQDMAALQGQCLAAGDAATAEDLARSGVQLSRHLTIGEGSRALIDQLVGFAVERIAISPLAADQPYDFLEGTVAERLGQLDAQKAAVKEMARVMDQWIPTASEADLANYFERYKLYGETGAMTWLRQRQAGR
jgi:hypothetical protein